MSLDFEGLKAKLNKLKNTNRPSDFLFRPEKGKQVVRLVPLATNSAMPFVELYFHYFNGKTILSPRSFGHKDPIAEFADKLRNSGEKESWQYAKQFQPKMRTYAPVIVRGKEKEGVKLWAFGKTVYQELLATIADPDYGDITDPKTGRDLVIEFTPATESPTGFAQTAVRCKPNQSVITTDAELLKTILTKQPNITELYTAPTYEELEKTLEAYLNPGDAKETTASASADTPAEEVSPTATKAGKKKTVAADAADEFDAIFDQA
jgi:hypothetical protein